jgi:hypothetical protein
MRNWLIWDKMVSNRWKFMLTGLIVEMYKKNALRQIVAHVPFVALAIL